MDLYSVFLFKEQLQLILSNCVEQLWEDLQRYKKNVKTNGESGSKGELYQWDHTHNDIEVFNSQDIHKGSMNHTGEIYKGPKGYRIEI